MEESSTPFILAESTTETKLQRTKNLCCLKGWRVSVAAGALAAIAVALINIAVLVWILSRFSLILGLATVSSAPCNELNVNAFSIWAHLAINVLSTVLLAASNNCMQCLVSPTRAELDRAHSSRKWLDIGVNGWRNLKFLSHGRRSIWVCLLLSSVPLHLLYNSVVIKNKGANEYGIVFVDQQFVNGAAWNEARAECFYRFYTPWSNPLLHYLQEHVEDLVKLDAATCIQTYHPTWISDYGNLLLVSNTTSAADPILNMILYHPSTPGTGYWPCNTIYDIGACNIESVIANAKSGNWELPGVSSEQVQEGFIEVIVEDLVENLTCQAFVDTMYPVDYCLAQKAEARCTVSINVYFLAVVVFCNLIKVVCLLCTLFVIRFEPLVTVGDAISSFLENSDQTTQGWCTLASDEVQLWVDRPDGLNYETGAKEWHQSKLRWSHALSKTRQIVCSVLFASFWIAALALLITGLASFYGGHYSILSTGFGALLVDQLIQLPDMLNTVSGGALVANLPQLLLSVLYLLYNDIFTRIWMSMEYLSYAHTRKALRVSRPVGLQRSKYFLQLPYHTSIPLVICSTLLHWLVSQSIFFASVSYTDFTQEPTPQYHVFKLQGCGWSPLALILSLVLGGMMVVVVWLCLFFGRLPSGMPLARSCSVAISAACHRGGWDEGAAEKPLIWGEVGQDYHGDRVAHASFSSGPVRPLVEENLYA